MRSPPLANNPGPGSPYGEKIRAQSPSPSLLTKVECPKKGVLVEIVVPELGDLDEVRFLRWLRAEGEAVEEGEAVAEVEADKAVFVIESPATGVLHNLRVREGETVRPGETLAELFPE